MSDAAADGKTDAVRLRSVGQSRIIELNRPASLNTLNLEMVTAMTDAILTWERSDNCRVIIITGAPRNGKPVFCAGGDVVALAKAKGHPKEQMGFLATEYALNHLLGTCKKPIVSLLDGVTSTNVGGGAGVSIHGTFRVATENTVFAMPETAIGFIPDVGGTFFLSKLGALGTYLGLTGARLSGIDTYHARLATHYIPSSRLADVRTSLAQGDHSPDSINNVLESFSGTYQPFSLEPYLGLIEECFGQYEVLEIFQSLKKKANLSDPVSSKWAKDCLEQLRKASPTAIFLTLELLKRARKQSLGACFRNEYAICNQLVSDKIDDMYEGVTKKLILKSNDPQWKPATVEAVSKHTIDGFMQAVSDQSLRKEVQFHSSLDVSDYPTSYVLPSDQLLKSQKGLSRQEIMAKFNWKLGLAEKLQKLL